ncbi:ABC transporter ATP-binding protein [Paenibacillus polymyxa]|uniref:ABC transporter ATP-binding protein n=1 Tax=Paenibacillus polymyxa TaxID=1406 RepID=UPI0024BF8507|nr:ABC transporter ATP-binding protein [Paenibacillus polymyxa]WHX37408.1 ABC transporter ATP-binding protein [Paenibacillus polymyxa]
MQLGNPAIERRLLEMTYTGVCRVEGQITYKDPVTGTERPRKGVIFDNQPCALSQASLPSAAQTDTNNDVAYDGKLFIAPDIVIPSGSRIFVTQDGMSYEFQQSGEPFIYPTHQEIKMKRVGKA